MKLHYLAKKLCSKYPQWHTFHKLDDIIVVLVPVFTLMNMLRVIQDYFFVSSDLF